jgi:hypothetical protein
MFDKHLDPMVHDLGIEVILPYGNSQCNYILYLKLDVRESYLSNSRCRLVPILKLNINGSRNCKGIILL